MEVTHVQKDCMTLSKANLPMCRRPHGQWATLITDMAIGDVVYVANRHEAERLRNAAYKQQKRIATRVQDDGTIKVWRVL